MMNRNMNGLLQQVFGQITDLHAEAKDGLTEGENSVAGAKKDMLLNMYDDYRVGDKILTAHCHRFIYRRRK
jgi:hypothetical protein